MVISGTSLSIKMYNMGLWCDQGDGVTKLMSMTVANGQPCYMCQGAILLQLDNFKLSATIVDLLTSMMNDKSFQVTILVNIAIYSYQHEEVQL